MHSVSTPSVPPDEFPEYLTMHQALAWVRYRDATFALRADADQLWAEKLYGLRTMIAGQNDLRAALESKRLVAEGAKRHEDWCAIPSASWLKLDVAPRDPARHSPYEVVRIRRDDLLRIFPATGHTQRATGRRKGSGSFQKADSPLLLEMQELIAMNRAVSPDAAAMMVAERAMGGGTLESKATRLAKRYRASERK